MERKWTYLLFALGGLVVAYLLLKVGDWAWSYYSAKPNGLVIDAVAFCAAGVISVAAIRNERVFTLGSEVTAELKNPVLKPWERVVLIYGGQSCGPFRDTPIVVIARV